MKRNQELRENSEGKRRKRFWKHKSPVILSIPRCDIVLYTKKGREKLKLPFKFIDSTQPVLVEVYYNMQYNAMTFLLRTARELELPTRSLMTYVSSFSGMFKWMPN